MDIPTGEPVPFLDLPRFDISPENGFLGAAEPLKKLPGHYFAKWEELLSDLPRFIQRQTLRDVIHQLPELEFSNSTLKNEEEWKRAYLLLCFLGQGYIWMAGEAGIVDTVPKKIAIPWFSVSRHLGIQPIGTYAAFVLYNYGIGDPGISTDRMDNLHALLSFTGTGDESHFYLIHVQMELAAAPAITAVASIYDKMHLQDNRGVMECLKAIKNSIVKIQEVVNKMYQGCNPTKFFVEIRQFFAGTLKDVLPNGLIYEGVDTLPMNFHGASAGQSSVLYMLDNFLGTTLSGEASEFVSSMIDYMPPGHREFLSKLKGMPSTRDYCQLSGNVDLVAPFNEVVQELVKFRNQHIILATRYIINQKENSINPSLDSTGTGGTHAIEFLKSIRDATTARAI